MMQLALLLVGLVCATQLEASSIGTSQNAVKTGFHFIGTVNGKILLAPLDKNLQVDFFGALTICNQAGYSLATIEGPEEDALLEKYFAEYGQISIGFAWIDGSDIVKEGEFHSIRTGDLLTHTPWVSGRPATNDRERACIMWKKDNYEKGKFFWDVPCKDTNAVVCELRL